MAQLGEAARWLEPREGGHHLATSFEELVSDLVPVEPDERAEDLITDTHIESVAQGSRQ